MGEYLVLAMILFTLLTLGSFTLYLLERNERATLDAKAFAQHWGIVQDPAVSGGLDPKGLPAPHPAHRITMLKRSATAFGATLGRTTGWVHRAELARNGVKSVRGAARNSPYRPGCGATGPRAAVRGTSTRLIREAERAGNA